MGLQGKSVFLPSKRLLYDTPPLLRTLLRTSVSIETLTRTLLRSTSFKEPSKNPSKSRVRLHDPLAVHPKSVLQGAAQRGAQFYFIFAVAQTLFSS